MKRWVGLCWLVGCGSTADKEDPLRGDTSDRLTATETGAPDDSGPDSGEDTADSGDTTDTGVVDPECPALVLTKVAEWDDSAAPRLGGWGAAVGDLDGDGIEDLLLASRGASKVLLGGSLGLTYTTDAVVDGLPLPPGAAAAMADLDDDGDMDVFLGTEPGTPDLILENLGGLRFSVTELPDSDGFVGSGVFADLDGDGRLDLVVGRRLGSFETIEAILADQPPGDRSSLYLQTAPLTFVDASDRLPADIHDAHTQAIGPIDVDADGDLDLFWANDFGPWIQPDALLLNDGTGHFTRAEDCFCALSHYGMSATVADLDRDHLPDLYVTDIGGPELLLNFGDGSFYDATLALGAQLPAEDDRLVAWGAAAHDLDRDGWTDLAVAFGHIADIQQESVGELDPTWTWSDDQRDALLLGGPDGFTEVSAELGFDDPGAHRGVVTGDFDGDGRDELVLTSLHHTSVWDVDGGCPGGLRITLDAGPGNAHGIGARVEVVAEGTLRTAWMLPATTSSASSASVSVGLGNATVADSVRVVWPDGSSQSVSDVPAGALHLSRD